MLCVPKERAPPGKWALAIARGFIGMVRPAFPNRKG
jgi:hypothetical protein